MSANPYQDNRYQANPYAQNQYTQEQGPGGPIPGVDPTTGRPYTQTPGQQTGQQTDQRQAGGASGWWSNSALTPGWQTGQGVTEKLTPGTVTSGQDTSGGGAGFVPDWQFTNGQLLWRASSHPGDHTTQESIMRAAAGYMQRGLGEKDAYDLAVNEMHARLNQIGAAGSSYTILPYQQGMVQRFAAAGGDPAKLGNDYWNYMNQAATYANGAWHDNGKGDLYAQGAAGNQGGQQPGSQPGQQPGGPSGGAPTDTSGMNPAVLANLYLSNPDAAVSDTLRQLDADPNVNTPFTEFARRFLGAALPTLFQSLQLQGGDAMDQIPGQLPMLENAFFKGGGGGYGALADIARQRIGQLGALSPDVRGAMDTGTLQNLYGQLSDLGRLGANPALRQAYDFLMQRTMTNYAQQSYAHPGTPDFGAWLTQNNPFGVLNF